MKCSETEANNETKSITNTNAQSQCPNLNTTVMDKHQNTKLG